MLLCVKREGLKRSIKRGAIEQKKPYISFPILVGFGWWELEDI